MKLRFHFLKFLHGSRTPRASDATVLEAALFESVAENCPSISPNGASFDVAGDSVCAIEVFGEDRGGQTEDGRIRAGDRLLLRRKSLKAQHGAEDLPLNQWNVQRL